MSIAITSCAPSLRTLHANDALLRKIGDACHFRHPLPPRDLSRRICVQLSAKQTLSEALDVLMHYRVRPNKYIFTHLLKKEAEWECVHALFRSMSRENRNAQNITTFILRAAENGHFRVAQEAFLEGERRHCADETMYQVFIEAAKKLHQPAAAKAAFNRAQKQKLVNAYTYRVMIDLLGEEGKVREVEVLFRDACVENKANAHIACSVIAVAKRAAAFEVARGTFCTAVAHHWIDAHVLSSWIDALGVCGTLDEAIDVFYDRRFRDARRTNSYTSFITAMGKFIDRSPEEIGSRAFRQAQHAFNTVRAKGWDDEKVYASYITVAGKMGDACEVTFAFSEAQRAGKANAYIYKCFIYAARTAGTYAQAEEVFAYLVRKGLADRAAYNGFIDASMAHLQFEAASTTLKQAIALGLAACDTFCIFIQWAVKQGEWEEAIKALKEARQCGCVDDITYSIFIDAAGKSGEFERVQEAFSWAKVDQCVNAHVYNAFIDAAGKSGRFSLAERAFRESVSEGNANVVTFNCFIEVASKNGHMAIAEWAFSQAKTSGAIDIVTYNVWIDALVSRGRIAEGVQLFQEAKIPYKAFVQEGVPHLDLHDFSHGSGIAALHAYCKAQGGRIPEIVCIPGVGNHGNHERLAFREKLLLHIAKTCPQAVCTLERLNPGVVRIKNLAID